MLLQFESYCIKGGVAMHTSQLWVCLHEDILKNFKVQS